MGYAIRSFMKISNFYTHHLYPRPQEIIFPNVIMISQVLYITSVSETNFLNHEVTDYESKTMKKNFKLNKCSALQDHL